MAVFIGLDPDFLFFFPSFLLLSIYQSYVLLRQTYAPHHLFLLFKKSFPPCFVVLALDLLFLAGLILWNIYRFQNEVDERKRERVGKVEEEEKEK